jgi:hypothetical protein
MDITFHLVNYAADCRVRSTTKYELTFSLHLRQNDKETAERGGETEK